MELVFQKTGLPYLKYVLQDIRNQEETGEMIVPDSEPDMESIIFSYADAVIRGKDCKNGCVVISGGIHGGIIYAAEDNIGPKNLRFYLPYTMKFEHPAITEQAKVICKMHVRSADGRMLNSRKAMLRVNLCCSVTVMEEREELLFEPSSLPETIQTLDNIYTVSQPIEMSEKAFTISETLEFQENRPPVVQIVKENCRLELHESKLVGNKGVFKGLAYFKCLYRSEDAELYTYEQQIPFSQYCEFGSDYEDERLEVIPVLTGYDLQTDGVMPLHLAQLSIHILVQCVVHGNKSIHVIEDAFCIGEELLPKWQQYHLNCRLDDQLERVRMRCQFHEGISRVLDSDVYVDAPSTVHNGEDISVTVPILVQILAVNESGALVCMQERMQDIQKTALSEHGNCVSWADVCGTVSHSVFSGGAEVHYELLKTNCFTTTQDIRSLCGGEVRASETGSVRRPSVIIKRTAEGTELWTIAKENQSRIKDICEANKLANDVVLDSDRMLLIPVG